MVLVLTVVDDDCTFRRTMSGTPVGGGHGERGEVARVVLLIWQGNILISEFWLVGLGFIGVVKGCKPRQPR